MGNTTVLGTIVTESAMATGVDRERTFQEELLWETNVAGAIRIERLLPATYSVCNINQPVSLT
jgi:hypothetical protein